MIYKEANILFPNCAFNFTDEEWFGIYRDSKDYAECFGVENGVWEDAEKVQEVKCRPLVRMRLSWQAVI